ncbi:MAG: insulinase family protein [Phycisphaerae bacterium]|nr:insulinase family protein [Phycisphaerae bacterium]MDW8261074.1 pitrilysin family protein [Phycisphaerales bacterium]
MPLEFKHHRLPNGLDILAEINRDSHSFAAGFFVKTGSRDETEQIHGVSHFLEHMMFKGSEKYTWQDVNRMFDEIGARYNAFTSQEMTCYYANVLPEYTDRVLDHLAHLLRPAIRQADFDTEKNVILEEIAMYLDDPGHRLYEALMQTHFDDHPLARSVLGSPESIRGLTRSQMAEYFSRRYGPGNMVLAVAGQMDFGEVVDLVGRYCGDWPAVDARRDAVAPRLEARRRTLPDSRLNRQYTMGMTPAPSAQDERRFAARVLADVIGDSDGSRFYWALVDKAIAEDADFGFYPHDGCGSFYLALTCAPQNAKQALNIALAELQRVKDDLAEDEVERARNKIASSIVLSGELPLGRMRAIGSQWIYCGEYRSLEQDMESLQSVSADSLRDLMREFPFEPMTIVSMGPESLSL